MNEIYIAESPSLQRAEFEKHLRAAYSGQQAQPQSTIRSPIGASRILSFFLVLCLVAFCLNIAINHGLRRLKTSKFGSLNRMVGGQVNADIIINGSSRALSHYDPRRISSLTGHSAYNIGLNSSQIDFELAMLQTYLKHNTRPKLVIQNLDLFSFETTKKGAIYDPGYYVPYLHEDEIYNFLRSVDSSVWKWKYIPLYGYAVEDMRFTWVWGLLGCLGINGREDYFMGFNPRASTWNRDFDKFKANLAKPVSYAIESGGIVALEKIVALCRTNDIKVILVYSPEYHEMQGLESNRGEIIDKFRTLSSKLGIPFWDYSDSAISMRRECFNNSQHLNYEGAEIFSDDIGKRLALLSFDDSHGPKLER